MVEAAQGPAAELLDAAAVRQRQHLALKDLLRRRALLAGQGAAAHQSEDDHATEAAHRRYQSHAGRHTIIVSW